MELESTLVHKFLKNSWANLAEYEEDLENEGFNLVE